MLHSTSHGGRFTSQNRLQDPSSYKRILSSRHRGSVGVIRWYASRRELTTPRLGMATPKRFLRTAVERNRIKRLIRESFRLNQDILTNREAVIVLRNTISDEHRLRIELNEIWHRISEIE